MIDINRITRTRDGYPVTIIRVYEGQPYPILADVEYEGHVESETFTKEGRYNTMYECGYDLVVDEVKNRDWNTKGMPSSEETKVEEQLGSLYDALYSISCQVTVCLFELDAIKISKK